MLKRIVFFILFYPFLSFGQQESYYSIYWYNMNIINPAFAGAEGKNTFLFTSRQQWTSIDDAPSTLAFSYSSARKNNVGLGLSILSDKVFIEQQTFAYVDFSYKLQMSESTLLYLGLKAGGNFYNADPNGLPSTSILPDPAKRQLSQFNPNIGIGGYLKSEKIWLSFSIPRMFNSNRAKDLAIVSKDRVHTYLGGGAYLSLSESMQLKPSIMLRKVNALPVTMDLTGMLSWKSTFDFGISYRTSSSMSIISLINIGSFGFGYAYEIPTESSLSQLNLKTHELVLRINLGTDNQKIKEDEENSSEEK